MRHVILTCKNHPDLRWSCKEIAVNEDGSYNGARSIFFNGVPSGRGMYHDLSGLDCTDYVEGQGYVAECTCPSSDLTVAPEDALVKKDLSRASDKVGSPKMISHREAIVAMLWLKIRKEFYDAILADPTLSNPNPCACMGPREGHRYCPCIEMKIERADQLSITATKVIRGLEN